MNYFISKFFIIRTVNGFFALAAIIIFTRLLSEEQYGDYAICIAIANGMCGIFYQWLYSIYARYFIVYINKQNILAKAITLGFIISTILCLLLFIILFFILDFTFFIKKIYIIIVFFIGIFLGIYNLLLQAANSNLKIIHYGIISWFKGFSFLIIGIILIKLGLDQVGLLLAYLLSVICIFIIFKSNYSFSLIELKGSYYNYNYKNELFRYGLPLVVNNLAINIVDIADRFIIYNFLGSTSLAHYSTSYDLITLIVGSLFSVLYLAKFPTVLKFYEKGEITKCKKEIHKLGKNILDIGFPVVFIIIMLSEDISKFLLAANFVENSTKIMPIIAIAIFLSALKNYYFDLAFQLTKNTKYLVYISFFMAFFNLLLNLVLINDYGIISCAWVTFVSFLTGSILSLFFGKNFFALPSLFKDLIENCIAAFCMILLILLLPSLTNFNNLHVIIKIIICNLFFYCTKYLFVKIKDIYLIN